MHEHIRKLYCTFPPDSSILDDSSSPKAQELREQLPKERRAEGRRRRRKKQMSQENLTKDWLELVGKEKLQTFQGAFAQSYGVGVCFVDRDGAALTVSSQSSLFCHRLKDKEKNYCNDEHSTARNIVLTSKITEYFTCGVGLSYFLCPVVWQEEVVAYVQVGSYILEHSTLPEKYLEKYHIPIFSKEEIETVGHLLGEIVKLLDVQNKSLLGNASMSDTQIKEAVVFHDLRLSEREQQVVWMLCNGLTNRNIGDKLTISEKTVKTHITNILKKINRESRLQIVLYYLQLSMVQG